MKDYFIKLFFALLAIGIMYGIAYFFKIDWLLGNYGSHLVILPLAFVAGWGGWYLYKRVKN
ncbi:hypothetical protein [Bacillus sp. ISL-7]|uniref:hypothetical protein n=1 Tax=Bacillus sp. ISL-7 TaxID=2819136 RepID=UPI001BE568E9|nr:hypothetical protein [Bacillus sp. ISL-7]MBT2739023.1 hypothetical protein [Bacillus sp. ISL-7]